MYLSLLIEQFIYSEKLTSVPALCERFAIDEQRCRQEVAPLARFGVEISDDGMIGVRTQ